MLCDQCKTDHMLETLIWNGRYRLLNTVICMGINNKPYFKEITRKMTICKECFDTGQLIDNKIYGSKLL